MNKESALSILVFFASGEIKITRQVVACSAQICLQHLVMSPLPSGYLLTLICSVLSCLRGIVPSTVTVLSPTQRRNEEKCGRTGGDCVRGRGGVGNDLAGELDQGFIMNKILSSTMYIV